MDTVLCGFHFSLSQWKCQQVPFSPVLLFKCLAASTKERYPTEGGTRDAWAAAGLHLIAASLRARHVPFTVLIAIAVIDLELGRCTIVELQQSLLPPTPAEILEPSTQSHAKRD